MRLLFLSSLSPPSVLKKWLESRGALDRPERCLSFAYLGAPIRFDQHLLWFCFLATKVCGFFIRIQKTSVRKFSHSILSNLKKPTYVKLCFRNHFQYNIFTFSKISVKAVQCPSQPRWYCAHRWARVRLWAKSQFTLKRENVTNCTGINKLLLCLFFLLEFCQFLVAVPSHSKTMTLWQTAAGIWIFPFEEEMVQMTDANSNSRRGNYIKRNFSECYS